MKRFLRLFLACLLVSWAFIGAAYANIMITPTRVVFDERDRYAVVNLINGSDETKVYLLEWKFMRMQEGSGGYERLEEPFTDFDLSQYVDFSPRRVTLAPGAVQKVRLALRRPADVPTGDYHIHLKFKLEEMEPSQVIVSNGGKNISTAVKVNVSYTIPVIARFGEVQASAEIERIDMGRDQDSGKLYVEVPVARSGTHAVLGYLRVFHLDKAGNERLIGEISNAHIFPEINKRIFKVQLNDEIQGGRLRVELRHLDKDDGFIYSERVFDLE